MTVTHSRGIGCGRYFAPIHLQPVYRNAAEKRFALPVTECNPARVLALPFFNKIEEAQIEEVCETLTELTRRCSDLKSS
jgi:perosamine synthetase